MIKFTPGRFNLEENFDRCPLNRRFAGFKIRTGSNVGKPYPYRESNPESPTRNSS
jgi:hypothetical protein